MPRAVEHKRSIYHYRKALETLADEPDLAPRRLFTLMFPLHRVSVRGHERRAEDYEELEWFIIQAIGCARIESIRALQDFYALDETLVRQVVAMLQAVGHLNEDKSGHLTLTQLGRESLKDARRYERYESRQVLYFDAFTCSPLCRGHYRLRFFEPGDLDDEDRALYSFGRWQPEALRTLARQRDRADYNVPDEVEVLEELDTGSAYLPMHIVEVVNKERQPALRVFTNVRGRRDTHFESLLSKHPEIVRPLLDDQRPPREVIGRGLSSLDLPEGSYRLDQTLRGAWRVTVPDWWTAKARPDGAERIGDVGEYVLVSDYCVRVWSDETSLRRRAACVRILNWLEHTQRELESADVHQYVECVSVGLDVPVISVAELGKEARSLGFSRALEVLSDFGEQG